VKKHFGQRLLVSLGRESKNLSGGQEFEGLDGTAAAASKIFTTLTGGQGFRHRLDEASRLSKKNSSPLYLFMVKLFWVSSYLIEN
jgi:hypothetical protein